MFPCLLSTDVVHVGLHGLVCPTGGGGVGGGQCEPERLCDITLEVGQ